MFGFFKKKFDAKKHLELQIFDGANRLDELPDDGVFRFVTSGLAKWGRRELEMVGVPVTFAVSVQAIFERFATHTVTQSRIADRQTYGDRVGPFPVVVRSFETTSHGLEVSRLADVDATEVPDHAPRAALTTVLVAALEAEKEGDQELGRALLHDSVSFFKGQPFAGAGERVVGGGYNTENFLSYLALAARDSENREAWLRLAFERSPEAMQLELGVEDLPEVPPAQLKRDAAQLVVAFQTATGGDEWGPERMVADGKLGADLMALVMSPLLQVRDHQLVRSVSPLPFPFRRFFYEAPVREALRGDAVLDVVAELYAVMRTEPARVLAQTADARDLYRGKLEPGAFGTGDGEPEMAAPLTGEFPAHAPALSRLLSAVGRLLAAGLSCEELRAHYALQPDDAVRERAQAKVRELETWESRHYAAAMGMDPALLPF